MSRPAGPSLPEIDLPSFLRSAILDNDSVPSRLSVGNFFQDPNLAIAVIP